MASPASIAKKIGKRIVDAYRTYAFSGKDVECNICGWKGSRFFGHSRCPNCQSFARSRLIPTAIEQFGVRLEDAKVLHVAPNASEYLFFSQRVPSSRYDRLDSNAGIRYINMVGDLRKLDLPDDTYDFALIWHVFEHIPDDVAAMREVHRVLKRGGSLLVSVPIYPTGNTRTFEDPTIPYADYQKVHGDPDHCRSCGTDYSERLVKAGFHIRTLNVATDLSESTRSRHRLSDQHVCWLATKD